MWGARCRLTLRCGVASCFIRARGPITRHGRLVNQCPVARGACTPTQSLWSTSGEFWWGWVSRCARTPMADCPTRTGHRASRRSMRWVLRPGEWQCGRELDGDRYGAWCHGLELAAASAQLRAASGSTIHLTWIRRSFRSHVREVTGATGRRGDPSTVHRMVARRCSSRRVRCESFAHSR